MADPHQLQQVFLNIINNARQAIEAHRPKGTIWVTTETMDRMVRVLFRDDGPGISAENISKIFNPFFTTKEVGKGTGLGLSLSYGIIKEHGGSINVHSQPGAGATFTLELPIAQDDAESGTSFFKRSAPATFDGSGKRILVVDDEELILSFIREALSANGCQLDVACDGETALARLREQHYDVTVCDWRMPGLTGQQLYEQVRAEDATAATRFIFMTGDVMNEKTQSFLKETGNICLSKPFSVDEFRSVIGQFLKAA
jgi:two-component system NtrC family sensor kinase